MAAKQLVPEQTVNLCLPALKVKVKDLPSIYVMVYSCMFLLLGYSSYVKVAELVFVLWGTYFSWLYLRFFQPKEGGILGDQHNEVRSWWKWWTDDKAELFKA
eukprot:SAG31_NODE_8869_length_1370_cov_2.208497_2_plen_102_part_00